MIASSQYLGHKNPALPLVLPLLSPEILDTKHKMNGPSLKEFKVSLMSALLFFLYQVTELACWYCKAY